MKAQPLRFTTTGYEQCEPSAATHLRMHLPGPLPNRILPVMIGGRREGTPNWTWNGSVDLPTVRPSVLTRGCDESGEHVCHSWINDGKVQFLGDCSHALAGQTVDLLEVD